MLLPGADVDDRGLHARLDRLERRIGVRRRSEPVARRPSASSGQPAAEPRPDPRRRHCQRFTPERSAAASPGQPPSAADAPLRRPAQAVPACQHPVSRPTEARAQLSVTDVRRLWPEVLEEVKGKRRFTWILLSQNAQVAELRNGTLLLAMSNAGARDSFARGGNEDVLREAIVVVMGADFAIETMVDPSATPSAGRHRVRHRQLRQAPTPQQPAPESPVDPHARTALRDADALTTRDAAASRDDSDLEENAESHTELLARHLGAEIIAEEDHGA